MPRAVRLLRQYEVDMVSAYRFDRTGEGYLRAIYTFFYNLMIRWMFRVKARDINFAFKLCRRRIFERVQLESEGSFIDAELFIRTTGLGYEVLQIGVDYFPRTRGESTLASPGHHRHDPARDVAAARRAAQRCGRAGRLIAAGSRPASARQQLDAAADDALEQVLALVGGVELEADVGARARRGEHDDPARPGPRPAPTRRARGGCGRARWPRAGCRPASARAPGRRRRGRRTRRATPSARSCGGSGRSGR